MSQKGAINYSDVKSRKDWMKKKREKMKNDKINQLSSPYCCCCCCRLI